MRRAVRDAAGALRVDVLRGPACLHQAVERAGVGAVEAAGHAVRGDTRLPAFRVDVARPVQRLGDAEHRREADDAGAHSAAGHCAARDDGVDCDENQLMRTWLVAALRRREGSKRGPPKRALLCA